MANKVFSSYSSGKSNNDADQQLIIEIGSKHLICYSKSFSKQQIKDFEFFKFDKESIVDFNEFFSDIIDNSSLLNNSYLDTKVFLNSETTLFVPFTGFTKDSAADFLNLVYGDKPNHKVLVDDLSSHDMYNIYWIPSQWIEILSRQLSSLEIKHTYSKLAEQLFQKRLNDTLLKVLFYENQVIVALVIDNKLHFIQSFTYQSPQDILYYLLSIVQRFHLNTDHINLELSGMIDVRFELFNDLKKYFKNLSIEQLEGNHVQLNFGEFQQHYFIPFFNLSR